MSELSALNTSVLFTNWTNEDFSYPWGGTMFHFPARSSEWIAVGDKEHNAGLARHFTKHLVDRELNARNVPTDHFTRKQFEDNCMLSVEETQEVPVLEVEIHVDTGLVKAVTVVGHEDVVKGIKTTTKAKQVVGKVVVPKKVEKATKATAPTDTFEE